MLKKLFATNPKNHSNSTDVDSKRYINNYLLSQDKYLDYSCLSIIFFVNVLVLGDRSLRFFPMLIHLAQFLSI